MIAYLWQTQQSKIPIAIDFMEILSTITPDWMMYMTSCLVLP